MPIETPPRVALRNPNSFSRSSSCTVALEPGLTVRLEDELAERLLLHVLVLEAELRRHDRVEHRAACRRIYPARAVIVVDPVNGSAC